ncbi:MAG: septum site-determining protein MinC [Chloroflexi bacterium]|nr:MAG: septum site-determining protein MinC [Chloroflexota bacterium]
MSEAVTIKGIREGLLVTLTEAGPWTTVLAELEQRLTANPAFFKGGRVILEVGDRPLDEAAIRQVRDLLVRHDVLLLALRGRDEETVMASRALGLAQEVSSAPSDSRRPPFPEEVVQETGLVIQRTLRSGQRIEYPGHIIILGDVNPGAEIVAGGHVIVWGRLQGTVHAGAGGDERAVVCALDLAPTQLRIGSYITRSPEERRREPQPEMAMVRDGQIVATPWTHHEFSRAAR